MTDLNSKDEISEEMLRKLNIHPNDYNIKPNRITKKLKKGIQKLGVTKVDSVDRVVLERSDDAIVIIENAEVYKVTGTDSYTVFGQVRLENLAAERRKKVAESLAKEISEEEESKKSEEEETAGEKKSADLGDIKEEDLEVVMEQLSVTREKAVALLRKHKTAVDAILNET